MMPLSIFLIAASLAVSSGYSDVQGVYEWKPPGLKVSDFAARHGREKFELATGVKAFDLHTTPSHEWELFAQQDLSRCQQLTHENPLSPKGPPKIPNLGDTTLVTVLLDLGRDSDESKGFRRSMKTYFRRLQANLNLGFPTILFMPEEYAQHLKIDPTRVTIIHTTFDDLKTEIFPYYDRLQKIRTSELWQRQAQATGWLKSAPQAVLPGYNPLVMSKITLLRRAAHVNPFNTKYLLFLDGGHFCSGKMRPNQLPMMERLMSFGFYMTHWPYATRSEVHGMTDKAMHIYLQQPEEPIRVVRGGIFGGTPESIECVYRVYMHALAQTMTDGYMGTEENILAIILKRFPKLFADFDNNSLGNHGDNCASFNANTMEVEGIKGPWTLQTIPPEDRTQWAQRHPTEMSLDPKEAVKKRRKKPNLRQTDLTRRIKPKTSSNSSK